MVSKGGKRKMRETNARKYMAQLLICGLIASAVAQEVVLEENTQKTGMLICVPENLRHELVYYGFPQEAIFAYQDSEEGKLKWCVVQVDNSAELIVQGVEYFLESIFGATVKPIILSKEETHLEDKKSKPPFGSYVEKFPF